MSGNTHITEIFEAAKPCSYFDDRLCDIRYKFIENCPPSLHYSHLERGWRRFGFVHFVPECVDCDACKTIRIDVKNFVFTKSHKRLFTKNSDLRVYIQKPTITLEHLELFNKYHHHMSQKKEWEENRITPQEYQGSYVDGANSYGKEILYFLGDRLICVALCDILPDGISSIYCYYDHEFEKRSLGKYSILVQLSLAKGSSIPYLFLGYWIQNHHSMGYKEDYAPFDILQNRPKLDESCIWKKYQKK